MGEYKLPELREFMENLTNALDRHIEEEHNRITNEWYGGIDD